MSAFWDSVFQIVLGSQCILRWIFMKQHNEPKKVQLFSKDVEYRQNLNFMYGCHGYQNKICWDILLSYIVMTLYLYFMILKIMCSYTIYLWIIKFSRAEVHFIFIFMSKLSYFPLLSMLKISKNDVTFEMTLSRPQSWWIHVFIGLICR